MRSTVLPAILAGLVALAATGFAGADPAGPKTLHEQADFAWREGGLREALFGEREIVEGDGVIALDAPGRAEDGAAVPISIKARFPQTADRYIERITLLIDANPVPYAGRFEFTQNSGKADLRMRIRLDNYSAVRAIAETSDGGLHMSVRYVKASGGCSAPFAGDLDKAFERIGRMKIRTTTLTSPAPAPVMLKLSHPNITGLEVNAIPRRTLPAQFITGMRISFDGQQVMSAETTMSISADPSFGFYFIPDRPGDLIAEFTDSQGNTFTESHAIE